MTSATHGNVRPLDDDSNKTDGTTGVVAAASAVVVLPGQPAFRYWVDEVLWSQGKVATVQIEEVLDAFGGSRTGGPPKAAQLHQQQSQTVSDAQLLQLQAVSLGAAVDPAPQPHQEHQQQTNSSSSSSSGSTGGVQEGQDSRASGSANGSNNINSSSSSRSTHAAPPAADVAKDPCPAAAEVDRGSDGDSSSGTNTGSLLPAKRSDDQLLGYHHLCDWDLLWSKSVYAIKAARQLRPGQVVSAIAGLNSLTMKKRMVQTLRLALGSSAFHIVPLSFCIPEELHAWRAWLASPGAAAADTGLWMLKTGQDAGKGLRLVSTQHAPQVAARPPRNPSRPQSHIKVAQQYITNPLLIQGRKFHLRLWLLVTSHRPLRAYLHCQGLVLFSSEAYDTARPVEGVGVKPAVGHVTNYARNEDTWVWGLEQLQQQLGLQQWQQLWQTMQQSTALTAAAVLGPLRAAHKWLQPSIANYGFQMLGLDYLVDEQLHPWLLEVNSAPSIMAVHSCPKTCQLIKKTKQAMLADMLAMVQHRVGPAAAAAAAAAEGGAGPDRKAGGWQSVPWREEFAAEMTSRGGFEPLMHLFPFHQRSIPWHESDLQLQQLLDKQQQQHVTRRP